MSKRDPLLDLDDEYLERCPQMRAAVEAARKKAKKKKIDDYPPSPSGDAASDDALPPE